VEREIGIVGGVGPYAGVDISRKILLSTNAHCDQEFLTTHITLEPKSIADRTAYLLDPEHVPNPGIAISKQIAKLYSIGARVFGIPCNTAHAKEIFKEANIAVPKDAVLLHMIQEVSDFLKEHYKDIKKVGVLSSTGTWTVGIYPRFLQECGFEVIVPTEKTQKEFVNPSIYDPDWGIKSLGGPSKENRASMEKGIDELVFLGAEAIILGCTEFPLALFPHERAVNQVTGWPAIDPTMILARALVREACPSKLRPFVATLPVKAP